jgi:hypothetical protein
MVCIPIVAIVLSLLVGGYEHLLAVFEDDATYYFLIAENIVKTGRSTFDGMAITTGYHPLWLVVNVALAWLTGANREAWLASLVVVCALTSFAQAALLQRLLRRLAPSSPLLVSTVVVLVSAWGLRLSFSGMECALATPMLVWCALELHEQLEEAEPSNGRALRLGLLCAFTGLARVDALPFGLACAAIVLFRRPATVAYNLRRGFFYALGLTPFAIYLGINHAISGSLLTTSAQAKALAGSLAWNVSIFANINRSGQVALGVSLLGALLVASPWTPLRGAARAVALLSFGFPLVYYTTLAVRSSWQIWSWYLYPIPLALSVALIALAEFARLRLSARGQRVPKRAAQGAFVASVVLSLLLAVRIGREVGNNAGARDTARALARFASTHPGYYAMGDRAGVTAFLVPQPFLQLEGLVADQKFLESVRQQRPLREVLEQRGVDYLVESVPVEQAVGRCLEVAEPKVRQAGKLSPKLRGVFCDPIARIPDRLGWLTTLVYAVNRPATSASGT